MTIEQVNDCFESVNLDDNQNDNVEEGYYTQDEDVYASSDEESFIDYESVYFKYCFEDCTKIDDILERLEGLKQLFEQYKKEGHELIQPVDTGYCFIDKICEKE
jgi:hypothetical protein